MKKIKILLVCLIVACSSNTVVEEERLLENDTDSKIEIDEIKLEMLTLDTVETSFSGFFHTHNNTLRYLDRRFGWLFVFDGNGNFLRKEFGRGDGPGEIPAYDVSFFDIKTDSSYFFLGGSWDGYNYSKDHALKVRFQIEWLDEVKSQKSLQKTKDPSNSRMYSFDYDQDLIVRNNYMYIPLQSQYINFNLTHDDYFTQGRTLAKVDIRDGKMLEIFGRRSNIYQVNKSIRLKSSIMLAHHPEGIMYGFETDSTIYIMDDSHEDIMAFGLSGKEMDMSYPNLNETRVVDDMIEVGKAWNKSTRENGYYTSLQYFPSLEVTMRTYKKGGDSGHDGLQIYHENVLIADVDVPVGFKIKGYISPYFYSDIMTKEDEAVLKTFRFKLEND